MDFSIFDAFPNAIISGVWEIGTCQHGTLVGNQYTKINDIDVVVDEGYISNVNVTPESITSDLLIYAYPSQLPVNSAPELVANYMLYNSQDNAYYEIVDAGVGKNQHTGKLEHIELKVIRTDVVNA